MRILFVHQGLVTFVQRDLDLLRSAHEIRPIQFTGCKGLARNICTDLWRLWRGVAWCDLTFSWFGKLHAVFAVLFSKALGKKAVVVSGGDEVAKEMIGNIPYGLCAYPLKRWFVHGVFGLADLVLAVSKSNLRETVQNGRANMEKTRLIYHGFSASEFKRLDGARKENLVVTVVGNITEETVRLKSLNLFLEAARLVPDTVFAIVGPAGDGSAAVLQAAAPPNAVFTGGLFVEELVSLLNRASVYVQASEWETFGCALAEAMLCECVPVVSRRASLPEVVGDTGFYVERLEPHELANKIALALQVPEMGARARHRIVNTFPLERRRKELLAVVASLEPR